MDRKPPPTVTVAIQRVNTTRDSMGTPTQLSTGRCEMYRSGHVCDRWLANWTVFVESEFSQTLITSYINRTLQLAPDVDTECRQLAEIALCRYALPRCRTTETGDIEKAQLCSSNCQDLNICKDYIFEFAFNLVVHGPRDVFEGPGRSFGLLPLQACQPDQAKKLPQLGSEACLKLDLSEEGTPWNFPVVCIYRRCDCNCVCITRNRYTYLWRNC